MEDQYQQQVAEKVRTACLHAALATHEDAGLQGLCAEGRWECAVQAIPGLDLTGILDPAPGESVASGAMPRPRVH